MKSFTSAFLTLSGCASLCAGFSNPSFSLQHCDKTAQRSSRSRLAAATGAPQYEKQDAVLARVESVGTDNFLLHVQSSGELDYQPGNVLALEIQPPETASDDDADDKFSTVNEKTQKDLQANQGWLRGPYTVSRCSEQEFQVLIKRVGYKSHLLATAPENTPVRFGGKFKVPIVQGVLDNLRNDDDSEKTRRVVMISTGVGIGPCIGATELLLRDAAFEGGSVDLLASFRTEEDVAMASDLEQLAQTYPTRFQWKPILTSRDGRLAATAEKLEGYLKPKNDDDDVCAVRNTHYHLIGNGQLVNEWKAGLEEGGVPSERVTVEAYFNHVAEPDEETIRNIATVVQKLAVVAQVEVVQSR